MARGLSRTEAVFASHPSQIENVNRMTIGGPLGIRGTYVSDGIETASAELRYMTQDVIFESKTFELGNVLDLTDKNVTSKLGVELDSIATKLKDNSNAYEIPQIIGLLAKENGYDAVKYYSAQLKEGVNWLLFK